jgi:hypothetical protein
VSGRNSFLGHPLLRLLAETGLTRAGLTGGESMKIFLKSAGIQDAGWRISLISQEIPAGEATRIIQILRSW